MKLIKVGDSAPDFSLKDNRDQIINLSSYRGKKVLLSWHPLAWTSVCTDQMRSLEVNFEAIQNLNTIPLGLSVDSAPSKKAWSAVLLINHVSLLADFWPHGKVAQDYGIFIEKLGMSERANIIIDEKGIVQWVKVYPMGQLPDIKEVLQVLSLK
ncbi:MAG TPA: redoxin domain-containing protein [Desulfitobacteriaceae bacterium]|nr:redoxin domain-containing protein [Desulfitobacteriaceae bacterium]